MFKESLAPEQARNVLIKDENLLLFAFLKMRKGIGDEELLEVLKKIWVQSENRNGAMLKCKGEIVEKVNVIGVAYFLAKSKK